MKNFYIILAVILSFGQLSIAVPVSESSKDANSKASQSSIEKKLDAIIQSNGIYLRAISDWITIHNNKERDGDLMRLMGLNIAKSALFMNLTKLDHMSVGEIEKSADKMNSFPKAPKLKQELKGVHYEVMTTKIGDFTQFNSVNHWDAVESCRSAGGAILTIKSKEENDFIKKWVFDDLKLDKRVWLSLLGESVDQNTTNDFIWADGSKIVVGESNEKGFQNWAEGQPATAITRKLRKDYDEYPDSYARNCRLYVHMTPQVCMEQGEGKECSKKLEAGKWVVVGHAYPEIALIVCQMKK